MKSTRWGYQSKYTGEEVVGTFISGECVQNGIKYGCNRTRESKNATFAEEAPHLFFLSIFCEDKKHIEDVFHDPQRVVFLHEERDRVIGKCVVNNVGNMEQVVYHSANILRTNHCIHPNLVKSPCDFFNQTINACFEEKLEEIHAID